MIEFYAFSWVIRILITFILGICVLTQTLALVFAFYRRRRTAPRVLETLLEISILCEILIFSLLHGQVVNAYQTGFVVPTGYENIRIVAFVVIVLFVIVVCVLNRTLLPLTVIPATVISLPIMENVLGRAFSWLFIAALVFFLGRSIKICVSSFIEIRTSISALSVSNAIDTLHTGILFSENDGYIVLINHQMQNLMLAITGKIFRNAIQFYDMLISDQSEMRGKKTDLEGQNVYLLPDGTAWMFTKTEIQVRTKNYIHLSAADVSEQWALTATLQHQAQELSHKSDDVKKTIANLHILSKKRELENAKMRAHDILGQRLTVMLRIIQNEHDLDYDLLTSLSKGLLAELKAEQNEARPYDELKSIQEIFAAIGVEIRFEGKLPENDQQASLFVDIIRKGSTNAVRHGFATEISIKFEAIKDGWHLKVSNNGHTTSAPITPGSGIDVMRKKVGAQGGHLEIIHYPRFTLSVVLPGGDSYE